MNLRERLGNLGIIRRNQPMQDRFTVPQTEICHNYDLSIDELYLEPDNYGELVYAARRVFVPGYTEADHEVFTAAFKWSISNRDKLRVFSGDESASAKDIPPYVCEQFRTHYYPCSLEEMGTWRGLLRTLKVTYSSPEEIRRDVELATLSHYERMSQKNVENNNRKVEAEPVKLEPDDITNLVLQGNGHRDHGQTDLITWHVLQAYLTALLGRARAAVNNGQY